MPPRERSKWQLKSSVVNKFRWILEDILTKDLTPEDLKSEKYKELKATIRFTVDHALGEIEERTDKAVTGSSKGFLASIPSWKSLKKIDRKALMKMALIALAMSAGAIIVEFVKVIPDILFYINSLFASKPPGPLS